MNRIPSPLQTPAALLVAVFVLVALALTALFESWRAGTVIAAFAVALLAAGSVIIDLGRPKTVKIKLPRR